MGTQYSINHFSFHHYNLYLFQFFACFHVRPCPPQQPGYQRCSNFWRFSALIRDIFSAALCWTDCVAPLFLLKCPKSRLFGSDEAAYFAQSKFTLLNLLKLYCNFSCVFWTIQGWTLPLDTGSLDKVFSSFFFWYAIYTVNVITVYSVLIRDCIFLVVLAPFGPNELDPMS